MRINRWLGAVLIIVLCSKAGLSQQLRLGNNPWTVEKSAVLELQSSNQGLLFTRIADTALINVMNPPDGMVVYFTPTKRLLLRANGYWQSLASTTSIDTNNISNFYLKVRNEFSAGTGISYNSTTGVISNAGVTSLNGNTGALTMDTGYISNFYQKVRGLFSSAAPITLTNGQIGITQASTSTNGYLSSTDWNTFNNKLSSIDTTNISNFYVKVRSLHTAGTGITYNSTTGAIANAGVLSLNGNTGALTMDTGYISNFYQKVRGLFSGGTGISYNSTTGVITASGSASGWSLNGNTVATLKTFGTVDNYDLPVITNNTERMRITNTGNVGIGTATFDGTNPEKLLVNAGTTSSYNLINAKGTINNYLQLNIQNLSSGAAASSDVVATANNGSESVNFVDMGINSSGYSSTGILGGANNAYLYSTGNDFVIGNQTANKNLIFFTGGSTAANEQMRIDGLGRVGIGVTDPTNPLVVKDTLEIRRTGTLSTLLFTNTAGTGDFRIGGDGGDIFWQGGGGRNLQMGSYWPTILMGDRQSSSFPALSTGSSINTGVLIPAQRDASTPLAIQAYSASQSANLTEWRSSAGTVLDAFDETGRLGVGTAAFDASNPEKLLVDAGTASSYNVISGKGTVNNYLQLNIQNRSTGSGASSDVVATADNGSESANFVDLGINSSGYSSSGVLGGANNAYLYSTGNDFVIGNSIASKNLRFFTGGTATGNERVRIDGNGNVGVATTAPVSKLDVNGSAGLGITTTSSNLTLDETNYSVIITGGTPNITLPAASTCSRRIYVIVNQTAGARTTSTYKNFSNANTTTVAANSSITIQSDGTNWYRIQ